MKCYYKPLTENISAKVPLLVYLQATGSPPDSTVAQTVDCSSDPSNCAVQVGFGCLENFYSLSVKVADSDCVSDPFANGTCQILVNGEPLSGCASDQFPAACGECSDGYTHYGAITCANSSQIM